MNRDPFPVPSPLTCLRIKEIIAVARRCYERGWSYGSGGNFSVREAHTVRKAHTHMFWQSPSGLCKGDLRPQDFIPIDLLTGLAISPSCQAPSAEMPVHRAIFQKFEDALVVVHTHPPALTSLSLGTDKITFVNLEMQKALGSWSHKQELVVEIQQNLDPDEMKHFATTHKHLLPSLRQKMIVLSGHGVYAWGKTPIEALSRVEALEALCRVQTLDKSSSLKSQ